MAVLAVLAAGCGPGSNPELPQCPGQTVCTVVEEQTGMFISVVNAPDKDVSTLYAFSSPDDPVETDAWILGFARTTITVNGGVSGDAGVEVAMLDGASLVELEAEDVPVDGWFTDEDAQLAFERENKWYAYDIGRHVIEIRPRVYFVRLADGTTYGMQFISYYDYTGASRHPTFRWVEMSQ
ncbi:hypothetical protein DB30_05703 [Enhygromyxa salina]|uniref:Uncharacterized protein n=1 Tax=Enhygromyxa salina TaxID=215803 RepID=A0A0C2CWF0_9BACT|nr:hypothetical protein DB30_05703 [Enhygromyxa salina]